MIQEMQTQPVALVFVLFGSYLCGSILRVLPVRWAEKATPPFKSEFPYPEAMRDFLTNLTERSTPTELALKKLPDLSQVGSQRQFNHWKNVLCMHSPDAFNHYQTFEARTRFFAGMLWAGFVGLLGGSTLAVQGGLPAGFQLALLSLLLIGAYGIQFRRVRIQEVVVLFSLYVSYLQTKGATGQQGEQEEVPEL